MTLHRWLLLKLIVVALVLGSTRPGGSEVVQVGTLVLDGLSFVSFADKTVLPLSPGGTIRFRFSPPMPDAPVSFVVRRDEVRLAPVESTDGTVKIQYSLAEDASGVVHQTGSGLQIEMNATVRATPESGKPLTYPLRFTTEEASAQTESGHLSTQVSGVRVVPGARYVQLVGATVNRTDATPQPGRPVRVVLSGTFDALPF